MPLTLHPPARTTGHDSPATVLINSIPKSGTYFTGLLLDLAGIPATGYHLRSDRYWDWNPAQSLDQIIRDPDQFRKPAALTDSLALVTPGHSFAHLDHTPAAEAALAARSDIRHIFLIRDLRACLLSSMRFVQNRDALNGTANPTAPEQPPKLRFLNHLRAHGRGFLQSAARQIGWLTAPTLATFRFEDIVQNPDLQHRVSACNRLLACCGATLPDLPKLLATADKTPTRTSTGTLSNWPEVWSDEAQALFTQQNGPALNAALGYHDAAT